MYIVSARKYRPDSFESLIGQDTIVRTLKNSIIRGQLAHAYLFCGPRGVGKTSAARIFAKTINCEHPTPDMEPCGVCESCRSFQEGRSYCIHELDAASNNSVEDIKALIEQVNIPPQVGKYSVFIVDEVHMLSSQAFNAFLKTLEEPPAHAIFILATTEKHKILPTILSRCQTYDFNRIGIADMVKNLRMIATKEGITIDDESLHVIAMKADGAMRDALTIFDQTVAFCGTEVKYEDVLKNLNVLSYEHSFALVDAFLKGDWQAALLKFDEVLAKGFNALHFVSALSSHLRDLIVAKNQSLDALLELPPSLKERYKEQSSRCSLQFLYDALAVTTACEAGYRTSVNPRLHIEFALMKLSFLSGTGEVSLSRKIQLSAAPKPQPSSTQATKPSVMAPVQNPRPAPAQQAAQAPSQQTLPASAPSQPQASDPVQAGSQPAPRRTRMAPKVVVSTEQDRPAAKDNPGVVDNTPVPQDEVIMKAWKALPEIYKSRPRLSQTLSSSKVEIEDRGDHKLLTFFVTNASQKKWVEETLLRNIESNICKIAGSGKIRLAVDVIPQEEVPNKPYMPSEQAVDLIANNPEVRNLVKDFDLDTK